MGTALEEINQQRSRPAAHQIRIIDSSWNSKDGKFYSAPCHRPDLRRCSHCARPPRSASTRAILNDPSSANSKAYCPPSATVGDTILHIPANQRYGPIGYDTYVPRACLLSNPTGTSHKLMCDSVAPSVIDVPLAGDQQQVDHHLSLAHGARLAEAGIDSVYIG